ncbi:ABC transporter permease [Actinomycetaceae bacterium WB03_NA08]|uniref:Transport permease protein n=1 Tax=Scrofimicrobium canadense TaxID=2652290 RepID=A0A6N7VTN6_9ACTO|nr:ABC transporter permease [Scrofimicrobium canadense]MSS85134.1 ABC transporter permease [Scrofimicrobium canadense]
MTSQTVSTTPQHKVAKSMRRIRAVSVGEVRLFLRTPVIMGTALGLPLVMVVFFGAIMGDANSGSRFTTFLVNTLLQWALLLVVYYNLTTVFVARREEGVFQRMSTGEVTPWEGVIAAALPSFVIVLLQIVIGGVSASIVFGMPPLTNLILVVCAVIMGCIVMVSLAAWTASFTSTVEGAQYSTMPLFFLMMFFSGVNFPLDFLPDAVQTVASYTPLYAVGELMSLGLSGYTTNSVETFDFIQSWSHGLTPLLVLLAWSIATVVLARSTMRFAKRR